MKTLIVDDDLRNIRLLQEIVVHFGRIDVVNNGEIAVDVFAAAIKKTAPYELVFLDIVMPVMDGQEVLRKMRALETQHAALGLGRAKIIMVSGMTDTQNVRKAFEGLCDGYCVKPIVRDEVVSQLRMLDIKIDYLED
jgi:two-component system chemotaxis response regulator CheY